MLISLLCPRHIATELKTQIRFWTRCALVVLATFALSERSSAGTTIHVTTPFEGVSSGGCTVQEAIYSAEFGTNIAISHTDQDTTYPTTCEPGTGDGDTIVLKPGEVYSFDKFWDGDSHNYMGPTATPIIFKDIIIQGNGATLQWVSGANPQTFRLFAVGKVPSSGPLALSVNGTTYSGIGSLTLQNVYVKNFHVKGGDGRDGGGGGLGAGGAIYVDDGASLTVDNSTFENNGAVGGNGSSGLEGGGGGLFGNGGAGGAGGNGGGGGGGARGDGGKETSLSDGSNGGGGGGTVFSGTDGRSTPDDGGSGGYLCGGGGGGYGDDGQIGGCPGGGGGGGGGHDSSTIFGFGNGGNGAYGGGGGGAFDDGGVGGYGGGGGSSGGNGNGGNGGFGGGGGSGDFGLTGGAGKGGGGFGSGNADEANGGGGDALGGAIFSAAGIVVVRNSTFFNNYVTRGVSGGGSADNGGDSGGAIFAHNGSLTVQNSTITANGAVATGAGGGLVFYTKNLCSGTCVGSQNTFTLENTIIANTGAKECANLGTPDQLVTLAVSGSGNLVMQNNADAPCPGVVTTSDPQLQSLQLNPPGNTPTMAILLSSPAADAADSGTFLAQDQRSVDRPQHGAPDIGAYEARPPDFSFSTIQPISVDVGGSGSTTIGVTSIDYFKDPVRLTTDLSALPSNSIAVGPSAVPDPLFLSYNQTLSSTLTLTLAPTVPAGSYQFTVTGDDENNSALTHSVQVDLLVKATAGGMMKVIGSFLTTGAIDKSGIANALTSKLSVAQTFITAGDNQTATNALQALLNQLNAQSGKHINASAASALITDTQALQASLGGLRPNPLIGYVANSSSGISGATVNVLNGSNAIVASAVTDSAGFYFFPLTRAFSLGSGYTLKVTLPKGYKVSSPSSQKFTWQGSQITFSTFVLN
jgi:FIMAH domain-containing protein